MWDAHDDLACSLPEQFGADAGAEGGGVIGSFAPDVGVDELRAVPAEDHAAQGELAVRLGDAVSGDRTVAVSAEAVQQGAFGCGLAHGLLVIVAVEEGCHGAVVPAAFEAPAGLGAGFQVRVWNRTRHKAEPLTAEGAYMAEPNDLATALGLDVRAVTDVIDESPLRCDDAVAKRRAMAACDFTPASRCASRARTPHSHWTPRAATGLPCRSLKRCCDAGSRRSS